MRFLIFALFFHCSIMVPAQQRHFEVPMGWRGKKMELHTISNKNKTQSCTFAVNSDSIRAFVFNRRVRLIRQFGLVRNSSEKILGGFIKDSMVYLFTKPAKDELHSYVLEIATGKIRDHYIAFDLKKEKAVENISAGDRFLYFTSNKNTSEFSIYNFTGEQQWDTLRYTFPPDRWEDLVTYQGFSPVASVKKVDLEGEASINTAVKGNKLYPRNDTLFLVMNNHRDSTHVYSFDLENKKVNTWLIKHHEHVVPPTIAYSDNSFLLRNKLFYVIVTPDSLCIQVVDLYTGAINRSFVANREDEISFKNTPIMQEGGQYVSGTKRELGKTKQLLRKMVNADAVITATMNNSGQVELIVGSYAKLSAGGGDMVFASGSAMTPMVVVPTGGVTRSTWLKSARFKTLLNASTFEHIEGEMNNSINEKIEYWTADIKIPAEAENLFMTNGNYYYAYYSKGERKLIILKF
ncbi:hypothetical protein [Niastella populi]|nr:hypothetical protein [Niastella populi]